MKTWRSYLQRGTAYLLRAPLLHFAGLGLVLLISSSVWWRLHPTDPSHPDREQLYRAALALGIDGEAGVVRQRLAQLSDLLNVDGTRNRGSAGDPARDLGFVETDPIIRRHIEALADLALHQGGAAVLPSEAEVARYYDANADRFMESPRVRLAQVYFSLDRRGSSAEADARATLERLRAGRIAAEDASALGDPFVRNLDKSAITGADLARVLGVDFAAAVDALPTQTWVGPLHSPYGEHLVWVHERRAARRLPLEAVRNQIVHHLTQEHSESLAARRLELLRQTAARQTP